MASGQGVDEGLTASYGKTDSHSKPHRQEEDKEHKAKCGTKCQSSSNSECILRPQREPAVSLVST